MRRFLLTSDNIDILCLVYSIFRTKKSNTNRIRSQHTSNNSEKTYATNLHATLYLRQQNKFYPPPKKKKKNKCLLAHFEATLDCSRSGFTCP